MSDLTRAFKQQAPSGGFMRTPEQIERDHRAAEMRSQGLTYQQIGDALSITKQAAHQAVRRAIDEIPKEGTEQVLTLELTKLDRVERYYHQVLGREHYKVGNTGKVVLDPDGQPIMDESPRMQAADGILKAQTSRAKLLGLNAPTLNRSEVMVYDVDRDSVRIVEAQLDALRAMGLEHRVEEFRDHFVTALSRSDTTMGEPNWTSQPLVLPQP